MAILHHGVFKSREVGVGVGGAFCRQPEPPPPPPSGKKKSNELLLFRPGGGPGRGCLGRIPRSLVRTLMGMAVVQDFAISGTHTYWEISFPDVRDLNSDKHNGFP